MPGSSLLVCLFRVMNQKRPFSWPLIARLAAVAAIVSGAIEGAAVADAPPTGTAQGQFPAIGDVRSAYGHSEGDVSWQSDLEGWFATAAQSIPGARFCHGEVNHAHRHYGKGRPLVGTSWLNRPLHVGWFIGSLMGDDLIGGRIDQESDIFGGYRLGIDFDHYWGTEFRLGFAAPEIVDSPAVIDPNSPPPQRDDRILFWDAHLLYYPWGDAQWRPYASIGLGVASIRFNDELGQAYNEVLFHVPIGIGAKYQFRRWCALRFDAMDNLAVGTSSLDTMHNLSFTFGVEVHAGGFRTSYYPWNPSIHYW